MSELFPLYSSVFEGVKALPQVRPSATSSGTAPRIGAAHPDFDPQAVPTE